MDRQIASVAEDNGVAVLAFSVVAHSTGRVLSREIHIGLRHAFHLDAVSWVGDRAVKRHDVPEGTIPSPTGQG